MTPDQLFAARKRLGLSPEAQVTCRDEEAGDVICTDANCARHSEFGSAMPHADAIDDDPEVI